MIAYVGKDGKVAMISSDALVTSLAPFDFSDSDPSYLKHKSEGGYLHVRDGKLEHEPPERPPKDPKEAMMEALEEADNFAEFKKKLSDKLK